MLDYKLYREKRPIIMPILFAAKVLFVDNHLLCKFKRDTPHSKEKLKNKLMKWNHDTNHDSANNFRRQNSFS